MTTPENTSAPEPVTDEQLAAAFPGQDVAALRAAVNKSDGVDAETSPNADAETTVEYPDYIPEKFRQGTVEEATQKMATSYAELEKARSKPVVKPEAKPEAAATEPAANTEASAPAEGISDVSINSVMEEFVENDRTISEESYAAMEAKGMSRELLDGYILGQEAIAGQLVTKVHEVVGGADAYDSLMTWANNNLTDAEIDAFDHVTSTGDVESIKLAVGGLKAKQVAAGDTGTAPNLLQGGDSHNDVVTGAYESRAEMTADMKDPRYKTDPAFREQVKRKLDASNIW